MSTELITLATKLLETYHLNVPERRVLPAAGIPASALVTAVEQRIAATGWFPDPPTDAGHSRWPRIESRGTEFVVHTQYEIGMMRFSPVCSVAVGSVLAAVRAYVHALGGFSADGVPIRGSSVDGVPIDWNS